LLTFREGDLHKLPLDREREGASDCSVNVVSFSKNDRHRAFPLSRRQPTAKPSDVLLCLARDSRLGLARRTRLSEEITDDDSERGADGLRRASGEAMKEHFPVPLAHGQRGAAVRMRRATCHPSAPAAPHPFEPGDNRFRVHRRSPRAGIVFSAMNFSTASRGMRTARPQFTRGNLRFTSQPRTVAGFTASISLASLTESNFVMSFTSARDYREARASVYIVAAKLFLNLKNYVFACRG
jgi:hypothetical protein